EPRQRGGGDPLVGNVQQLQVERVHGPTPRIAPRQRALVDVIAPPDHKGTRAYHIMVTTTSHRSVGPASVVRPRWERPRCVIAAAGRGEKGRWMNVGQPPRTWRTS